MLTCNGIRLTIISVLIVLGFMCGPLSAGESSGYSRQTLADMGIVGVETRVMTVQRFILHPYAITFKETSDILYLIVNETQFLNKNGYKADTARFRKEKKVEVTYGLRPHQDNICLKVKLLY
jgi:hypothetical protein